MSEIVQPQVWDAESIASCFESLAPCLGMEGEHVVTFSALRNQDVPSPAEQRDSFIVPNLLSRVLSVPDDDGTFLVVHIFPPERHYFAPSHCGIDGKFCCVAVWWRERFQEPFQLVLFRSAVPLVPAADQAKVGQFWTRLADNIGESFPCIRVDSSKFGNVHVHRVRPRALVGPAAGVAEKIVNGQA